jgi:lipopolysaccharide assembly outer membrane protein LptD (OstA)
VPERISFRLPFSQEKGGGSADGTADHLDYLRHDYVVATGGVELSYRNYKFQAARVAIDLQTKTLTAEGDVIVDEGPRRLTSDVAEFDLETKTGVFRNAKAFLDPDIYFSGKEIEKTGDATYIVTQGVVTSCSDDVPDWSFKMSRARIKLEGYARLKNTRLRIKKLPVLYLPYMLYPAKTKRASGFLFPNLGYTEARGGVLGLAYFQTMGESADMTLFADLYTDEFYGFGNEFRYRPNEATKGTFEGYAIEDPVADDVRWKVAWDHESNNLPGGMRGVVRVRDFSDFNFFRDFERDFNNISIRNLYSSGYVSGNWGPHSLNLLVDQRETFIRNNVVVTQRQLPELEYRLRPTRLGKIPAYLSLNTAAHYLSVERTASLDQKYGRADFFPLLTVPVRAFPWLSASLKGGQRFTWYEKRLTGTGSAFADENLTREFATASADIIGPSISKVFDKGAGSFGKFKHVIEPRFQYLFVDDFEDQDLVPLFDEVDRLTPRNGYTVSLINRLLAKPKDEENGGGSREIMSFELAQAFSLKDDEYLQRSKDRTMQTKEGPIVGRFRFNPSSTTRVESQFAYNTLFSQIASHSLSGNAVVGRQRLGVSWFTRYDPETGDTTSNQLRTMTGFELWPDRLRWDSQVNYDIEKDLLQQHRHFISYTGACYGLRLEYQEFKSASRNTKDFRFALSFKNIGTFLDLTGRSGASF